MIVFVSFLFASGVLLVCFDVIGFFGGVGLFLGVCCCFFFFFYLVFFWRDVVTNHIQS